MRTELVADALTVAVGSPRRPGGPIKLAGDRVDPARAWSRLLEAESSIGKVETASEGSRFLVMRARYGLNPVRLRITVLTSHAPETSLLEIQARGQDVWGVASRRISDRLCAAL